MDSTQRYIVPGAWAGLSLYEEGEFVDTQIKQRKSSEIFLRIAFFCAGLWTLFLLSVWWIFFAMLPLPGSLMFKMLTVFLINSFAMFDLWAVVSLISFLLVSSFRALAFLYYLSESDAEHFYYSVFAIGFTWFYDLGMLVDGRAFLQYKPFLVILDTLARFVAKNLDWYTSFLRKWSFIDVSKVNPRIGVPRRNFVVPVQEEDFSDILKPDMLALLSRGDIIVSLWDSGSETMVPLVHLAFAVTRFVACCRVDAVNLLFICGILLVYLFSWMVFLIIKFGIRGINYVFDMVKMLFILGFFCVYAPYSVLLNYSYAFWYCYWHLPWVVVKFFLNPGNWIGLFQFSKTFLVMSFLKLLKIAYYFPIMFSRYTDAGESVKVKVKLQARFNQSWVAAQRVIDDIALPSFIRRTNFDITPESVQNTLNKLRDLGWPVNVSVTGMPEDLEYYEYPEWFLTSFDFHQGIHNMRTIIDEDLQMFEADTNLAYKRTETYASFANELAATSRYFLFRDYSFTDLAVDDIWVLVGEIFQNSRLTPFSHIIKKWEKKYGLGAFAKIPSKHGDRKLSRKKFMKTLPKEAFEKLWAETFKWAPTLDPINPVSIKNEALPSKKWLADKVRTVIGAPLTSYISSTIWNYMPNHNFKWESTPIKVGMPLNGGSMAKIYAEHARRDIHFAADCTAFDSTLSGKTLDIIKDVRKRGFENHRDYKNICHLIDNAYWEVQNGILALTSRGRMYKKGTGLSTGHSSTSMDNSIGLVSLYLRAWKELTGLTAHEFRHFCTLSAYGDDNMCSYDKDAHPNWTPLNIQKVFKQWGVEMRIEASGPLENIEFLSKFSRRPNQQDKEAMASMNLPCPDFIIYHNKDKLIGKIKADMVPPRGGFSSPKHQLLRVISFMQLTAHHHDVYNGLVNAAKKKVDVIRVREKNFNVKIPTYAEIMTNWYFKRDNIKDFTDHEVVPDDVVLNYGQVTIVDAFSNFLSRFADFVNPDVYNSGLTNFIQRPLRPLMSWAVLHTREANAVYTSRHLASIMQKSAYDWMTNEVELPMGVDNSRATGRLFKHWLYMMFCRQKGAFFSRYILMLDKKLADIKYILFGHIDLQVRRLEVPIWNTVLAALIGCLPDFEGLPDYRTLPFWHLLPYISFGSLADSIFGMLTNLLFASVPANFMASNQAFKMACSGTPFIIEAATGAGKTTAMINAFTHTGEYAGIDKVVIVEPRQSIVMSIVPYMREKFNMDCTGACEGFVYDNKCKIVYCTPYEVILHEEWFHCKTVFVLDEFHVDEPLYKFIRLRITNQVSNYILTSATPLDLDMPRSLIAGANVWSVTDVKAEDVMQMDPSYGPILASYNNLLERPSYQFGFDCYRRFVTHYLRNANPFAKSLVFVNTKKEVLQFIDSLTGPSGGVVGFWSGHVDLPQRWSIIVATSVADVGLTLPSVDHVFTTNSFILVRGTVKQEAKIFKAKAPLLKQRRGRTGRTNNGRSIVFKLHGLDEFEGYEPIEELVALISANVDVDTILKFQPDLIAKIFGDRSEELVSRAFQQAKKSVIEPALRWQDGEASLIQSLRLRLESRISGHKVDLDNIVLHPTRQEVGSNRGWSVNAEILDFIHSTIKFVKCGIGLNMQYPDTEIVMRGGRGVPPAASAKARIVERAILNHNAWKARAVAASNKAKSDKIHQDIADLDGRLSELKAEGMIIENNVLCDIALADLRQVRTDSSTWPNWSSAYLSSYLMTFYDQFVDHVKTLDVYLKGPKNLDGEPTLPVAFIHDNFIPWMIENGHLDDSLNPLSPLPR